MALISIPEVRAASPSRYARTTGTITKSAGSVLNEFSESVSSRDRFDIFLSHSYADAALILDLKQFLETFDLSVYVDWETDNQLDRTRVTKHTAAKLRERMEQCEGLLYATSENASESVWMPWELGYFDALRGRCAIVPLTIRKQYEDYYKGQEYLGLYPYVTRSHSRAGTDTLWVETRSDHYVRLDLWLNGQDPYTHH